MDNSKIIADLSKDVSDSDKELLTEVIALMEIGARNTAEMSEIPDLEAMKVLNKCGASLEVLKRVAFNSLVSEGASKETVAMFIISLTQLATIAGGVSFFDFQVTENMAREMKD